MESEEGVENTPTHKGPEVEECPGYLGDGKGCLPAYLIVAGRKG